jgi:hypothetical protein
MSKDDITTVRAILDKVKKDKPQAVANAESTEVTEVKEVADLQESFNRILGVFNPDQIVEEPGDYKTVMSYTGKDAMPNKKPMSYNDFLKKEKGIERGVAGIKGQQHITFGKEYRDLKKADKLSWADESVEEAPKPDFLDLDKDGNKTEPMKKAAKEDFTQADADSEKYGEMQDYDDYRDAMMQEIETEQGQFAGKSDIEIAKMLRADAESIGYADVSDVDRHPSEAEWLNRIADELDGSASEEVETPTSGMDAPTSQDGESIAPTDLNKVILRIKDLAGIK